MNAVVAWFARNTVAANMLMFCIIGVGLLLLKETPKEILPPLEPAQISITLKLPGASPEQAYALLCSPAERAISSIDTIVKVSSTATTGSCVLIADLAFDSNASTAFNHIEERLRLIPLPDHAERPRVQQSPIDLMIARLGLVGTLDYRELLALAETIQNELIAQGLSKTVIRDAPNQRINIALSESRLQQYQLSFNEVAQALLQNTSTIPAGSIHTDKTCAYITLSGNYSSVDAIANSVIRSFPDGGQLTLADIAHIHDGFSAYDVESRVDGKPAISISVYQEKNQDVTATAEILYRYIKQKNLAENVELLMLQDNSKFFTDRMTMLKNNGLSGLVLVFVILLL